MPAGLRGSLHRLVEEVRRHVVRLLHIRGPERVCGCSESFFPPLQRRRARERKSPDPPHADGRRAFVAPARPFAYPFSPRLHRSAMKISSGPRVLDGVSPAHRTLTRMARGRPRERGARRCVAAARGISATLRRTQTGTVRASNAPRGRSGAPGGRRARTAACRHQLWRRSEIATA